MRGELTMLTFILGCFIGGIIGIFAISLCVIGKDDNYEGKEELKEGTD